MIRQLERAAGLDERDDAPEVRLDRLEALLARAVADPRQSAALLAPLLGPRRLGAVPGHGSPAAATQGADPPGPGRPARRPGSARARPGRARGPALARPDHARAVRPRRRPAPAPAGAARRDLPSRAAAALDGLPACHASHPRPSRARRGRGVGRCRHPRAAAAGPRGRDDPGADRGRAPVRRGADQGRRSRLGPPQEKDTGNSGWPACRRPPSRARWRAR